MAYIRGKGTKKKPCPVDKSAQSAIVGAVIKSSKGK